MDEEKKFSKHFTKKIKHQTPNEEFKNIHNVAFNPRCNYVARIDPYGRGCYFNCSYCYSKSIQIFREGWYPNNPGRADWDKIVKVVQKKVGVGDAVRIGGMTDCFQPIERLHRLTYKLISLLNRKRVHYLIVTKSPLVVSQEYLKLFDKDLAHIQVSVPCTDNDFIKKISNAPTFEESKMMLETLYSKDFDTTVRCSPFLYNYMDFDKFNSIGVDKCLVEFLRVSFLVKKIFNRYMDLSEYSYTDFKDNNHYHYHHLPLEKKLELLDKLDFPVLNVCEEIPSHERYFRENVNYNKNYCATCCEGNVPKQVYDDLEYIKQKNIKL